MVLFIVGGVLGLTGIILWLVKNSKEGKSAKLQGVETSQIREVNELFESMRNSAGDGKFAHFVELKGKAHSDSPLTSELAKVPVAYYEAKIVREYERLETKRDSNGRTTQRWVKHTDTVSKNEQWASAFGIKDDTGFIGIDPTRSELHLEQLFSRFENGEPTANSTFGSILQGIAMVGSNSRTIGYRQTELGIRLGSNLYVVGEANDRDGALRVSKPSSSNPFIVSTKSEEEIVGNLGRSAKGLKIAAIICLVLGVAAAVAGGMQSAGMF